jgi:hypothetical protein
MDTQPHTENFRIAPPAHERNGKRIALLRWTSFSPQTRHKPEAAQTYNQGFLRVSAEEILVAKTAQNGRFFP